MAKAADLTGQRFGLLTAISYAGSDKGKGALWSCRCDCGNVVVKSAKMLTHHGKYASCGCYDGRSKRLVDLTGKRFGLLIVLQRLENDKHHKPQWLCQCDCGNQTVVRSKCLVAGDTKSCGCLVHKSYIRSQKNNEKKKRIDKPLILRHTHKNRLYNIWSGMHYRCENPNASSFVHYGGRNIKVCREWSGENGFEAFAHWAIDHGYADTLEIDRIDNDGDYRPSNCRWVDHQNNSFNRRARNQTGVSGVSYRKSRTGCGGAYRVAIMTDGKQRNIGTFQTLEEAKEARKQAEIKYRGKTSL